jgi:serine/threonine protein kinase
LEDNLGLRPFAVKVSREADDEKRMAHRKEFEITKNLSHPNIIKSIEFFDNGPLDEIHQVMEYVDGLEVLDAITE